MTETIDATTLLRLRIHAQGLARDGADAASTNRFLKDPAAKSEGPSATQRIAQTTSRMLALQGQDWRSVRWALGVRTPGTTVTDVHDAFAEGRIVRSWPMRGTIHVVAAEDIGWMQSVTNRRVLASAAKRRAQIELPDATLDRMVEVAVTKLAGGNTLGRDELTAAWTEAGIEVLGPWRYHTIWWMCQRNITVFGPPGPGGEPLLALASEWIQDPRNLAGDDALCELAARYTMPRGPVRRKDFAWWSGLTMRETDRAFALAAEAGRVTQVMVSEDPDPLWVAPEHLDSANKAGSDSSWLLLPAFDEHLLGYQNRDAQLDPAHFDRIVPGRNGIFQATVVAAGRVVGTWKRAPEKAGGVAAVPLPNQTIDLQALRTRTTEWSIFHGDADDTITSGDTP